MAQVGQLPGIHPFCPRDAQVGKKREAGPRALKRSEQNALLRAVEREANPRDKAIISLLLYCGLRVGELVNLKVGDLQIKERWGKVVVRGKGDKSREVPLPAEARKALKEYLEEKRSTGRLFTGQRGPLTVRGVQQMVDKYAYKARLEGLTPHVLRHTCATNLLNRGVDLTKVAAILGHENLNTTAVYTRPSFEDLMRAVEDEKI